MFSREIAGFAFFTKIEKIQFPDTLLPDTHEKCARRGNRIRSGGTGSWNYLLVIKEYPVNPILRLSVSCPEHRTPEMQAGTGIERLQQLSERRPE